MFAQLVLPLRDRRSVRVTADFAEEAAIAFAGTRTSSTTWMCSCWIECSFETALERALARGQEGLLPERTGRAYRTIYFPAQETHFAMDDPRAHATIVVENDPRLAASPSV